MGLIVDTNVFIIIERQRQSIDFSRWDSHGEIFVSAITSAELLIGVHRADSPERRLKRSAFVEHLLKAIPVLPFDLETSRIYAQMLAALPKNVSVGTHDLMIGATAVHHGFAVLTDNVDDFSRIPAVEVIPLNG